MPLKEFVLEEITVGTDPEFFGGYGQEFIPAPLLLSGTKAVPTKLSDGIFSMYDNAAIEINVPPSKTAEEFSKVVDRGIKLVEQAYSVSIFEESLMVLTGEQELSHPALLEFGCDPDFNAWTLSENPRPILDNTEKRYRTAGGHIHVGTEGIVNPIHVIKAMDLFLGVPSVIMDHNGAMRKTLYGNAGSFRMQPWGVEYRTLSNFWIFSDALREWAFNATRAAVKYAHDFGEIDPEIGKSIVVAINENNKKISQEIIEEFEEVFDLIPEDYQDMFTNYEYHD